MAGVSARTESGANVETRTVDRAQDASAYQSPDDQITVRVKDDAPEFFSEGERRKPGDEYQLSLRQARAASQWLEQVEGGERKPIPHEQQRTEAIPRTTLSGLARHERLEALRSEEAALTSRLDSVRAQIAREEEATALARTASVTAAPTAGTAAPAPRQAQPAPAGDQGIEER